MLPGPPRALPGLARPSRQFQRLPAPPPLGFPGVLPSTRPPPRMSPTPPSSLRRPLLSSLSSSISAPARVLGWGGEAAGGEGGHKHKSLPGRPGRRHPNCNEPSSRPRRFAGRRRGPPHRGSITTVCLPAPYCSHFARTRNLAQRKETGARRFGWLPAILLSHRARRVLGACEGTRARTRAHTLGSLDHALLALRPSALPPVKARRSALPSLRALGQKQALQLTSNLANKRNPLTSYRRGCKNGHTDLRFCPCRPILQTVIRPPAEGGGGEPHFIRPGEITIGVATPGFIVHSSRSPS